jgi:hypothetical protein
MGRDVAKEAHMTVKSSKRLVREGDLVAEVDAHLVEGSGRLDAVPISGGRA